MPALALLGLLMMVPPAQAHSTAEILGTWRGTSTCTDRVAAPACNDEVIVYDIRPGPKAGTVTWKADKIVNGRREEMGEIDLSYDQAEKCWRGEFAGARVTGVWCLSVDNGHMTGTAQLLPAKTVVRKVNATRP